MVMNKKIIKLNDLAKLDPFKVPDGYFEGLTDSIMKHLPDRISEEPRELSLWQKMQPWMYMAAMFAGIALMFKIFSSSPQQKLIKAHATEGLNLTSSSDIEDYYYYYEDELAKIVYDDTFYLTSYTEESIY
jgi:hypothetical protein